MPRYREPTPIPGPEAFETAGRDADLSQAAIVLSVGAAAGGRADRIDRPDALALPDDLRRIALDRPLPLAEAASLLDVDARQLRTDRSLRLPAAAAADLTRRLIDRPETVTAAALVEAALHSESVLVRTSAAVAALDTTGPRDDVLDQLVEGARARDQLTREIGRTGLARVAPQHALLRRFVTASIPPGPGAAPVGQPRSQDAAGVAVLTHGTFAANTLWWQPGGSLFTYLDKLSPPLHPHAPSFRWSGQYSDGARRLAARQLVDWMAGFALSGTDLFAHSHGGTVAHLATDLGLQFDRLVLMSWPVHGEWFPDFTKVRAIVDIRVHLDLVILADRGGQTFVPPRAFAATVHPHVNGWFNHSDTNDPGYWDRYDLPAALQV